MTTIKNLLLCLLLMFACAAAALGDDYADGRKAYASGDYERAAKLFEASARARDDAKSYYQLGLTYLKLNRPQDALRALETAQAKDSTLGFAGSPETFKKKLAEAQRKAGGASSSRPAGAPSFFRDPHLDQVAGDLAAGKGVMDYTGTLTPGDLTALEQVVKDAQNRGFRLHVYLIQPQRQRPTKLFTNDVVKYLNFTKDDILVVASNEGVYAAGRRGQATELDRDEIERAANEAAPFFKRQEAERTGMGLGMAEFARLLTQEASSDRTTRRSVWGGFIFIILGLIAIPIGFVITRRLRRQQQFREKLNQAINLLMNQINDQLGREFEVNARYLTWFNEYEAIKQENNWRNHERIDRLIATMESALRSPERYFDYKPGIREIKEEARKLGVVEPPRRTSDDVFDYFDGRPLKKDEAVVVALKDRDGQTVRVLTSREHAEQVNQGQSPKVLTREVNGQRVHWANDPTYDPYRDYRPYYGGPDWVDLWLMHELFSPHTHYGYGIFPYYHPGFFSAPIYVERPLTGFHGYTDWDSGPGLHFGSTPHYEHHVERHSHADSGYDERDYASDAVAGDAAAGLDFAGGTSDYRDQS
jgi:tetratricopeptide (TPR) repeat protein